MTEDVILMRRNADKLAYLFIAFALFLMLNTIAVAANAPFVNVLLYLSIAFSLLASNVPRVLDIPLHYAYPVRCVEFFTFGVAVVCFIVLCLHHVWA